MLIYLLLLIFEICTTHIAYIMKVIQVNPKYKLWYAFGLFAVFLLLLSVYYAVTRNITETLYNVPTWGIPCIFIYYIFIHRMKIMITDEKKLVYKLSYSLFYETIHILEIDNIILEKGFLFNRVIIYYNAQEKIVLHPQDSSAFLESLKFVRKRDK